MCLLSAGQHGKRGMMGEIRTQVEAGVLTLTLDNGAANAVDLRMARQMAQVLADAAGSEEIGAVVVTGAGEKAFCAGSDIGELRRLHDSGAGPGELLEAENRAFDLLAGMDIPTIAAVNGLCVGGGVELALCCDMILAPDDGGFSLPEIRLGVFPGIGATVRLPRRVGQGRAMEMMLTGREVPAAEALHWGLANRLAPRGQVFEEATRLARRMALGPRMATASLKGSMREGADLPEADALRLGLERAVALGASAEVAEGLRAFAAKEKPDFAAARKRGR
jgi:enoyl-CoA hydratase/carnithine racemase